MSILSDCQAKEVNDFTGANQIIDEGSVPGPVSVYNRNCEFNNVGPSEARTRRGFTQVWDPAAIITTLYNWLQEQYNRVIYFIYGSGTVVSRDIVADTEVTVTTSASAAAMMCCQAGYRLYMAFFKADGTGASPCEVWDGTETGGVPNVDTAFKRPLFFSEVANNGTVWGAVTVTGSGIVSTGSHAFGLVVTTWNGYQGALGPIYGSGANSGGLSIIITGFGTNNRASISVSPASTWPPWVNTIQIAMTTALPSVYSLTDFLKAVGARWYLVPGQIQTVVRGSNTPVVFDVNIDDVTLAGQATEITNTLLDLYREDYPYATGVSSLTGIPFNPHVVLSYNQRNVYLTRLLGPDGVSLYGTIFVSEIGQPQYITLDQHALYLPEFKDTATACVIAGTLFVFGPTWTYAFSDNAQVPVLWPPPLLISSSIGTRFPKGVFVNAALGYAWVVDHTGLYFLTGGVYPIAPSSFNQQKDWERINFACDAHQIEVIDFANMRQVWVRAPLDGATVSTHFLVWDYTNGTAFGTIRYCGTCCIGPDSKAVSAPTYAPGSIAVVRNTNGVKEIWISRGDSIGNVKRQMSIQDGDATESNPAPMYNDDGGGIDSSYKVMAGNFIDGVYQHVAGNFRVRGAGQINVTATSLDQTNALSLSPITATMTPSRRWLRLLTKQSEAVSYQLDNGATAGAFFYWGALTAYFTKWLRER